MPAQHRIAAALAALLVCTAAHAACPKPGAPPRIRIPGTTPGIIKENTVLVKNQRYYSPDKSVYLVHQGDGNLVLYKRVKMNAATGVVALWNTKTVGSGTGCAIIQGDGNLVVYSPTGKARWNSFADAKDKDSSWTDYLPPYGIDSKSYNSQFGAAFLAVQNDNNLVVYDGTQGRVLWHSGTNAK